MSKNLQWPKLRLQAKVEREPEQAFSYVHIGEYPNYHQRSFIQEVTDPDSEIHNQVLGRSQRIQ